MRSSEIIRAFSHLEAMSCWGDLWQTLINGRGKVRGKDTFRDLFKTSNSELDFDYGLFLLLFLDMGLVLNLRLDLGFIFPLLGTSLCSLAACFGIYLPQHQLFPKAPKSVIPAIDHVNLSLSPGLMFPSYGDIHLAPFSDEQLYFEHFARASFWSHTHSYTHTQTHTLSNKHAPP